MLEVTFYDTHYSLGCYQNHHSQVSQGTNICSHWQQKTLRIIFYNHDIWWVLLVTSGPLDFSGSDTRTNFTFTTSSLSPEGTTKYYCQQCYDIPQQWFNSTGKRVRMGCSIGSCCYTYLLTSSSICSKVLNTTGSFGWTWLLST